MSAFTPARGMPNQLPEQSSSRVRGRGRRPGESRAMTGVWNAIAVVFGLVMAFPIYWMILTTVKSNSDLLSQNPTFWPSHFDFSSYRTILSDPDFLASMRATAIITVGSVIAGLAVGFLAAVAVARFRFRGRNPFIVAILVVQMVPLLAIAIPLYIVLNKAGLYDQFLGVILAYLVFTIPYVVWTLRSFIVNIPAELDEAAMVDGCTRWGAFFRIILPLSMPGLVTTGVYAWIQAWNEFVLANTLLSSNNRRTSMVWLSFYSASPTHGADYGAQMAGALLVSMPVILLFVIFQRRVASGLTAGAVKG
jgi:N,N'-diacetylchitobiose transport system permease protein